MAPAASAAVKITRRALERRPIYEYTREAKEPPTRGWCSILRRPPLRDAVEVASLAELTECYLKPEGQPNYLSRQAILMLTS